MVVKLSVQAKNVHKSKALNTAYFIVQPLKLIQWSGLFYGRAGRVCLCVYVLLYDVPVIHVCLIEWPDSIQLCLYACMSTVKPDLWLRYDFLKFKKHVSLSLQTAWTSGLPGCCWITIITLWRSLRKGFWNTWQYGSSRAPLKALSCASWVLRVWAKPAWGAPLPAPWAGSFIALLSEECVTSQIFVATGTHFQQLFYTDNHQVTLIA